MLELDGNEKDEAIESGIVVLSGGRDINGNILLTIPTGKLEDIAGWEKEKLATLFLHMADIAKCLKVAKSNPLAAFHTLPLAFLADLRHASTTVITILVESLESVEHQSRGTISAIYFLSPKKKSKSQTLKKLLGLKPSKKRPRVPLFKIVLAKTLQELHTQIDVSHLTLDFCGTLLYNHIAWMHFYNVVIKCIEGCQMLLTRLNSIKDKVDLLQEYDTECQTSGQLQQLLNDLLDKFHMIISESSLPLHLVQSKQTLFLLEHPSSDNHIAAVHTDLIEGFRAFLRDLYSELNSWNTDLENTWKVTESRLTILIHLQRHRERAKEIERKICEHYHPLLREHPIVGKTLSQAELYRAHFTTTLYEPAKELLSQATEILEAVHKLKNGTTLPTGGATGSVQYTTFFTGLDISDINSCLTTSIQPFTQQLQHLQQVYVNVHIFHLLFEKTLIWYKKVLKFIPETLLDKCTLESDLSSFDLSFYNLSPHSTESLVYMPTEWLGAVRIFMSRHPPPRQEHIDRLDESIPQLVDRKLRAQARSLALRLRLIQRLLSSTHLPLQLVKAVLGWRAELFGNLHVAGHNPPSSAKQRNKSAEDIDSSGGVSSDKLQLDKSQILSKASEKSSGKRRSLGSAELETGIRKSGLPVASHEIRVEKALPKKTPSRTMFRTKSVEFNFNSSSTDGSVFDYDRAVNGLHQRDLNYPGGGRDMIKARAYPRRVRRESQDFLLRTAYGGRATLEDVVHSDQSELSRHSLKMGDPSSRAGSANNNDFKTDGGLDDVLTLQSEAKSVSEPETASLSSASRTLPGSQTLPNQSKYRSSENRPSPLITVQSIPDERFIRLTFTPKESKSHPLQAFKFESLESDKETVHAQDHFTEEEDSADGAPDQDPYDTLVQKIREVSASSLSNTEKLKRVSHLLSASTAKKASREDNTDESGQRLGRFSKSAFDLRQIDSHPSGSDDSHGEPSNTPADRPGETPLDAVLRMKRNLAKSLEELNLIGSPVPVRTASGHDGKRYVSELKIEPIYKYREKIKETRIQGGQHTESDRHEDDMTKPHASKSTFLTTEYQKRRQSSSDLESTSPVSNSVSSGQEAHQASGRIADKGSYSESRLLDYLSPSILSHRLTEYDSDDDPGDSLARTNLSYLASRNFLSPSFLRPAVSMKDLSSRPVESYHRGNPEFYRESEFQALEELEMLRTLQEDPLSNEFSKITPDRKKQSRIFTGDFIEKMKTEPGVNSDDQSTVKSDRAAEAPSALKVKGYNDDRSVPDINVDYVSFVDNADSLTDDGQEVEQMYVSDPYDRLATEAEQEHLSQEEVASSLRKTQRILEEEEMKRRHLEHQLSDISQEEDSVEGTPRGAHSLSHAASTDNGYGSWASKLVTALSTSSEGPDMEADFYSSQDHPSAANPGLF